MKFFKTNESFFNVQVDVFKKPLNVFILPFLLSFRIYGHYFSVNCVVITSTNNVPVLCVYCMIDVLPETYASKQFVTMQPFSYENH